MNKAQELRKHVRCAAKLHFVFTCGADCYSGETANISLGGAFLAQPDPKFDVALSGKKGRVTIELVSGKITTNCQVRYIMLGAGIAFIDLAAHDQEKIQHLIDNRL